MFDENYGHLLLLELLYEELFMRLLELRIDSNNGSYKRPPYSSKFMFLKYLFIVDVSLLVFIITISYIILY